MPKQHMVIVGGGFAGVTLARRLERILPDSCDIYLLSKTNVVTYNPLLPEVVGASVLPRSRSRTASQNTEADTNSYGHR